MKKNVKLFKSITALALAGGITLCSTPMVYAHNSNDVHPQRPSFEQLQRNNSSHCYIDTNNIVHKGNPPKGVAIVANFENFGYNLILNGQKILYNTEKVSDSMYHLYDGLNKDFGKDVMYKTYTEKDGIANLLTELLAEGFTPVDAMNFIGYIDSNIYTGYGEDDYWYQRINSNKNNDGKGDSCDPKNPTYEQVQKYGDSHCYITNYNVVCKGIPASGTSNLAVLQNFGDNLISNGRKIIYNTEKVSNSMKYLYEQLNQDFGSDVMYKTYTERDGIANLLTKLIAKGYSATDAIVFVSYIDSNVYGSGSAGKDVFWYQGLTAESKKLFGDKNTYLPSMPAYQDLINYGDSHCYVTLNDVVHKGIPEVGTRNAAILQNFGDELISNGRKILYNTEKVSDSMNYLYKQLNKDFGSDVMFETYTEKDGIANLLAELIDGGYSTIDAINFIQYVNSNVYNTYNGYDKNYFWYQGIEEYTDDYNINSEYIPDKNNDYDCHPKQYQKQRTHN
jgi:hypothetical protein